ncbi:MAG: tetratricopeptide repeat protein [Chlamydiia bacterium]|nr:tetratricopeptide repeat protein [Chlamydiia bacterium]
MGQWDAAYAALAPLIRDGCTDLSIGILYVQSLFALRRFTQASTFLDNLLPLHSDQLSLLREKGRIALAQERYEEALSCFQRARPVLQSDHDLADLAQAYVCCGDLDAGWELIEGRLKDSCSPALLAVGGHCCYVWERWDEAAQYFGEAVRLGARDLVLSVRLAHALRMSGQVQAAQRRYRDILDVQPDSISATLGLGLCFEQMSMHDRALMIYQSGPAWDCGDARILARAGVCAARTGEHRYGELYLREAIKRGQESVELLAHLAYTLEAQQRWQDAEQVYVQLCDRYPRHVAGHRGLAWLYGVGESTGLSDAEGLEAARRSLDLRSDAKGWELLSACEARAGNFEKARSIQERLEHHSSDQSTRSRHQKAARRLGRRQPLDEAHVGRALVA